MEELFNQARVYSTSDIDWKGGPQVYGKKVINPQQSRVAQSIECPVDVYSPGGRSQKHGHMHSAVFYVLKGKGHDIQEASAMIGKRETRLSSKMPAYMNTAIR